MNLSPFYSFPISRDELKALKEKLNSLDLETLTEKSVNLCRTSHLSVNLAHIEQNLFTIGMIDNMNDFSLTRKQINKILETDPEIKELFDQAMKKMVKEDNH